MKQGFVKAASATPAIRVADPVYNAQVICEQMEEAVSHGAKIVVFPELCITGYTCGDLFLQNLLLEEAKEALLRIMVQTAKLDAVILVGLPIEKDGRLYNVAAVLHHGDILGMIPKKNIPSYGAFHSRGGDRNGISIIRAENPLWNKPSVSLHRTSGTGDRL